ncbi:facilitated trehalose transporter Tret1-like [Planococcus citri]|uniref:facilitated trehalose transporter Tret1-like n=1 Tax=Planococcus citri TaxID=170843 RepID=UPI0031F8334E
MLIFKEILHQTLAVTPVNFNEFSQGIGYGWISPTLETLSHPDSVIPLNTEQKSWIASLQEIGRTVGPLLSLLLLDTIGRKKSLIISAGAFFLQWTIILFTKSVWVIGAIRLLFGIDVGINDVTSSIYFGENATPSIRGIFGSVAVSFFYVGVLLEYFFTNYFSYYTVALINAILGGIALITAVLLRESPQFLIMKGKLDQAKKNFEYLKGDRNDEHVQREFSDIKKNIRQEQQRKESLAKLFSTPFIYKITLIVFIQYTLTQATGFSAVQSFATLSFSNSGFFTKKELTILLGLVQLVAVFSSAFFVERFPRKTMLRTFYGLAALVHLCSAALFYTQQYICQVPHFSTYIFISIASYSTIYAVGILPSFCLLRGELFPQSIKVIGGCISIIGNSVMGIFINYMYLIVAEKYGIYMNYVFFSVCSFATVLFVRFKIPETRGKTLVDIQRSIDKKSIKIKDDRNPETI